MPEISRSFSFIYVFIGKLRLINVFEICSWRWFICLSCLDDFYLHKYPFKIYSFSFFSWNAEKETWRKAVSSDFLAWMGHTKSWWYRKRFFIDIIFSYVMNFWNLRNHENFWDHRKLLAISNRRRKMSHGILIILLREILPKIFRFSDIRVNLLFFGLSFKRLLGFCSYFHNFLAVAFNKYRIKLPVWPCFSCLVWCSNSPKTRPIFSSLCTIPLINQK